MKATKAEIAAQPYMWKRKYHVKQQCSGHSNSGGDGEGEGEGAGVNDAST